ncbi:MAG TPA: lipocalin family protein [Kofleriaceae bacterium]|nr:lipocalin family protein [Kofleriaceae bacterium]
MVNIRRSIARAAALLFLLPAVTACPGDDDGPDGDGADDALVGSWELLDDGEVESTYTFDADGAFAFDELGDAESAEHVRGTYTVDDGVLRMEGEDTSGDEPGRAETTYHAAGDLLAIGAYLADGDHDGPVGTWAARSVGEPLDDDGEPISRNGFDIEMELRDDGTLALDASLFGEDGTTDTSAEGTWTAADDVVTVSFAIEGGPTANVDLLILGDDAMGDVLFDRAASARENSSAAARMTGGPSGRHRRAAAVIDQDVRASVAKMLATMGERRGRK